MAESLYDKYGGFAAVSTIVHNFYDKILASESLKQYFDNVDVPKLIDHQIKFLCMVLGGPNNYEGRQLKAVHMRLKITAEAFGEVAGYLKEALEEAGVEPADIGTILGVVAGAQGDVVAA